MSARIAFLVIFGIIMFCVWALAKWGIGHWGWAFAVPMIGAALGISWLIDRRSRPDSE